eukprot:TRINITY_DN955_c0_g1_i1.p2 TRINITY_DN955_c0_g1~~TRINITY_DN955_c0_g1_i1.p2  ORF type:complete len:169 (+),score=5.66 TRINITY_DN955_c0_g1_i1:535-1041(+)
MTGLGEEHLEVNVTDQVVGTEIVTETPAMTIATTIVTIDPSILGITIGMGTTLTMCMQILMTIGTVIQALIVVREKGIEIERGIEIGKRNIEAREIETEDTNHIMVADPEDSHRPILVLHTTVVILIQVAAQDLVAPPIVADLVLDKADGARVFFYCCVFFIFLAFFL